MTQSVKDALMQTRSLRAAGKIQESWTLAHGHLARDPQYAALLWQHQPFFWEDLAGPSCRLVRRRGSDEDFLRTLWRNAGFMHRFHPMAPALPESGEALQRVLEGEYASLLGDSRSLHWTIRDARNVPWGLFSLTEISLMHRRAELLLGVLPGAPFGLPLAACLLVFRFYFAQLGFHKLYSMVFDDNALSFRSARHLGFQDEGLQRDHVCDPRTGQYLNLRQLGILPEEAFSFRNHRLMARLGIALPHPAGQNPQRAK